MRQSRKPLEQVAIGNQMRSNRDDLKAGFKPDTCEIRSIGGLNLNWNMARDKCIALDRKSTRLNSSH